jgi:hypothetical protein
VTSSIEDNPTLLVAPIFQKLCLGMFCKWQAVLLSRVASNGATLSKAHDASISHQGYQLKKHSHQHTLGSIPIAQTKQLQTVLSNSSK